MENNEFDTTQFHAGMKIKFITPKYYREEYLIHSATFDETRIIHFTDENGYPTPVHCSMVEIVKD